jgi:hypothetical protein
MSSSLQAADLDPPERATSGSRLSTAGLMWKKSQKDWKKFAGLEFVCSVKNYFWFNTPSDTTLKI